MAWCYCSSTGRFGRKSRLPAVRPAPRGAGARVSRAIPARGPPCWSLGTLPPVRPGPHVRRSGSRIRVSAGLELPETRRTTSLPASRNGSASRAKRFRTLTPPEPIRLDRQRGRRTASPKSPGPYCSPSCGDRPSGGTIPSPASFCCCPFSLALCSLSRSSWAVTRPPAAEPCTAAGTWKSAVEYSSSCPQSGHRTRRLVIMTPSAPVFGSATGVGMSCPQPRHLTKRVGTSVPSAPGKIQSVIPVAGWRPRSGTSGAGGGSSPQGPGRASTAGPRWTRFCRPARDIWRSGRGAGVAAVGSDERDSARTSRSSSVAPPVSAPVPGAQNRRSARRGGDGAEDLERSFDHLAQRRVDVHPLADRE
jgi:hypothetical protein